MWTWYSTNTSTSLSGLGALAIALVLICMPSRVALAQDAEDMERFEQHVKTGAELLDRGEHEDAIASFEQARRIVDHPRIAVTIAEAYEQWGRCQAAENRYRALLERDGVSDNLETKVRTQLDTIDQCVEKTTLSVTCKPSSATVSVGGKSRQCPFQADIRVGEHTLVVAHGEYRTAERKITLVAGEPRDKYVELTPLPQADDDVSSAPTHPMHWFGWGAIGVGTTMGVVGVVLDSRSAARADEIAQAQREGRDDDVRQLLDEADTNRKIVISQYAIGGALIATGIALHLFAPEAEYEGASSASDKPQLRVRPQGLGLKAVYRW